MGSAHICPHQMAFFLDNWIRKLFQRPATIVGEYIKEGDTVIDVGCGPGFFTIDMANMVGPGGRVVAVDLQPKMLEHVKKKAIKHGVDKRVHCHLCGQDRIGLTEGADFILAYYMIHETPDPKRFLAELKSLLKPNGRLLVVEPKMHVSKTAFEAMLRYAEQVGLKVDGLAKNKGGRHALFFV
jgi:ubiquinone/menaquinone biosynthesis C-methylase UbiE